MSSLVYIDYLRRRTEVYNKGDDLNYPSNSQIKTVINPLKVNYSYCQLNNVLNTTNNNTNSDILLLDSNMCFITNIDICKIVLNYISKYWLQMVREYLFIPIELCYSNTIKKYNNRNILKIISNQEEYFSSNLYINLINNSSSFSSCILNYYLNPEISSLNSKLKNTVLLGSKRKKYPSFYISSKKINHDNGINIPLPFLCKQMKLSTNDEILMPILTSSRDTNEVVNSNYLGMY